MTVEATGTASAVSKASSGAGAAVAAITSTKENVQRAYDAVTGGKVHVPDSYIATGEEKRRAALVHGKCGGWFGKCWFSKFNKGTTRSVKGELTLISALIDARFHYLIDPLVLNAKINVQGLAALLTLFGEGVSGTQDICMYIIQFVIHPNSPLRS